MERSLLRTLGENTLDLIYAKDRQGRFVFANAAVARMLGVESPQAMQGLTGIELQAGSALALGFHEDDLSVMQSGQPSRDREVPTGAPSTGQTRWLATRKVPIKDEQGSITGLVSISRDITERRNAEQAASESEARFHSLLELSSDWYWEQNAQLQFVAVTDINAKSGYQSEELIGKTLHELPDTVVEPYTWRQQEGAIKAQEAFRDLELRHDQGGETTYLSLSGLPTFDSEGRFSGYRGIATNITERKRSEKHAQYLATHDSLTGLPNRFMFNEILCSTIAAAKRYGRKFAVLFIDLDRFKNINDTLGHDAGDALLKIMAERLTQCLRESDVVARMGGDEFIILIQETEDPDRVARVARKVLSATIQPVTILEQECRVTTSIGICLYPDDAQDEQTLLKHADIAMYRAKEEGKNNYQFYSPNIKARSLERLVLENNLRMALERDEFFLHYQAKRDLKTGDLSGVEALVRWQHPDLGVVPPSQFIPMAEETGLIVALGRWVLKTACQQSVAWQRSGLTPLCMSVNLSARQFFDDNLVQDVASALEESGLAPELLEMEITEGMVMQDADRAIDVLKAIKALGVRLAIDDFGVGYSSLAQIKRFPIDTLKVDSSFIRDIPTDLEDRAIAEAIIAMGKTLSLTVVAEGVETREQETFLRDHACDQSQGYYFSRPISSEDFEAMHRQQTLTPRPYPESDA